MSYTAGANLFHETMATPRIWRDFLLKCRQQTLDVREWLQSERIGQVVFLGCGAQMGVAQAAAALTQSLARMTTRSTTPQDVLFSEIPPYDPRIKTLLVVLSRGWSGSGLRALKLLRQRDPKLLTLALGHRDCSLSGECSHLLVTSQTADLSQAGVTANSLGLLACLQIATWLSRKSDSPLELNENFEDWLGQTWINIHNWLMVGPPPRSISLLSSTPLQGLSTSMGLTSYHLTGIPTHPGLYNALLPTGLNNSALVVGLNCPSFQRVESAALAKLSPLARVAGLCSPDASYPALCPSINLNDALWALVAIPVVSLLSLALAIKVGRNPDLKGTSR